MLQEGGAWLLGPCKAQSSTCSVAGPQRAAASTGQSVSSGQDPGTPAFSRYWGICICSWLCLFLTGTAPSCMSDSGDSGGKLCVLFAEPHQQLFMECLDQHRFMQSPDLSFSCAWLQLLLSHGHGDRGSNDPRLPSVHTDSSLVRSFQISGRAGRQRLFSCLCVSPGQDSEQLL